MDVREKLVELLKSVLPNFRNNMAYWGEKPIYEFADCLLANGVTVQEHGYWASLTDCANAGVYCSVCNKKIYKEDYAWCNRKNKLRSDYCPHCGAKMVFQLPKGE